MQPNPEKPNQGVPHPSDVPERFKILDDECEAYSDGSSRIIHKERPMKKPKEGDRFGVADYELFTTFHTSADLDFTDGKFKWKVDFPLEDLGRLGFLKVRPIRVGIQDPESKNPMPGSPNAATDTLVYAKYNSNNISGVIFQSEQREDPEEVRNLELIEAATTDLPDLFSHFTNYITSSETVKKFALEGKHAILKESTSGADSETIRRVAINIIAEALIKGVQERPEAEQALHRMGEIGFIDKVKAGLAGADWAVWDERMRVAFVKKEMFQVIDEMRDTPTFGEFLDVENISTKGFQWRKREREYRRYSYIRTEESEVHEGKYGQQVVIGEATYVLKRNGNTIEVACKSPSREWNATLPYKIESRRIGKIAHEAGDFRKIKDLIPVTFTIDETKEKAS